MRHVNSRSAPSFLCNVLLWFNLAFLFRLSEGGVFGRSGEWDEERDLKRLTQGSWSSQSLQPLFFFLEVRVCSLRGCIRAEWKERLSMGFWHSKTPWTRQGSRASLLPAPQRAASTTSRVLLEMQNLGFHSRPRESEYVF